MTANGGGKTKKEEAELEGPIFSRPARVCHMDIVNRICSQLHMDFHITVFFS